MSEQDRHPAGEDLVAAVGAILFASDEPVPEKELARALGRMPRERVREALDRLGEEMERQRLGLRLERVAGGAQIATDPAVGAWVRRFFRERNRTRLTPAALETLAVIAYRQPVTAPEIQAIRGKDPGAALRGLLEKKLVRCLGRKKVVGSPLMYGTSNVFLEHFGLNDLDDLPSIEEFDQFLDVLESTTAAVHGDAGDETGADDGTDGKQPTEPSPEEGAATAAAEPPDDRSGS